MAMALVMLVLVIHGPSAGGPREPIVLRIDEVAVAEIDPAKSTDFVDSILFYNLYDTLVAAAPGGKLAPSLAESWTISPDGLAYAFKIRRGVKFHDGTELTAADVEFSLQRMMALKQGFSYLYDGWVSAVKASGPSTVAITLTRPYGPFLATLVRLGVVNRALVLKNKKDGKFGEFGDYGDAFLSTTDAGSGPYRIKAHNPQQLSVIEKFPGYWQAFAVNAPDEVRVLLSVEAATIRTLMVRREHDVTSQWLPTEIYRALGDTPGRPPAAPFRRASPASIPRCRSPNGTWRRRRRRWPRRSRRMWSWSLAGSRRCRWRRRLPSSSSRTWPTSGST